MRSAVPGLLCTLCLIGGNAQAVPQSRTETAPAADPNSPALAQPQAISATKRSLIDQLLEITGDRQQYEQMNQLALEQMLQLFPSAPAPAGEKPNTASPGTPGELAPDLRAFAVEAYRAMEAEIPYEEVVERILYPTYDRYFSEEDLRNLIAFYRTPTGQKFIAVSPQLNETVSQLYLEVFGPRIRAVFDRFMPRLTPEMK